ncbi:MAG: hypothetical protein Q8O58_05670 [Gallionella sp.]|nr:hypothetical protein [Gallionella sp.]
MSTIWFVSQGDGQHCKISARNRLLAILYFDRQEVAIRQQLVCAGGAEVEPGIACQNNSKLLYLI